MVHYFCNNIVYLDFVRDQGIESAEGKAHHICNIYYNHPFSSGEIYSLISSIDKNDDLSEDKKQNLKSKINKHLKSSCSARTPSSPIRRLAEEKGYQRKRPVTRIWNNSSKYNDSFEDDYFSSYDDDEYYDDYEL